MRINKNEMRVLIDVDKTLIRPATKSDDLFILFNYYNIHQPHVPMHNNIMLLKAQKARGYEVIVHSANGWQWAQEVVEKLQLTDHVDEVATKPLKYIDDKPADEWMQQVFVPED